MLDKITSALNNRRDLTAWSLRHITMRGAQIYAVGKETEAKRQVEEEKFKIEVFCKTKLPDGSPALGNGEVTLLHGGDVNAAVDQAALVAGLVANPIYGVPEPHALPDVALIDEELLNNGAAAIDNVLSHLHEAAAELSGVELTSAECFAETEAIHLVNSRGIDCNQESTGVEIEFVLQSRSDSKHSETQREMRRRRISDLNLGEEIDLRAQYTRDLLDAQAPPAWQGPIVIRRDALATFMAGDGLSTTVLQTLGSASSKYAHISPWEIGKPVFRGEVSGDPLTVWANRRVPYGSTSNRFDAEGLPARRTAMIESNKLVNFVSSKRYADYLKLQATGEFGCVEMPAGKHREAELLTKPYVEISMFSWFNPEPVSGDFSSEIRLGYLVENGEAKPFKGGQMVGNVLDALANVHWGDEIAFYGNYYGPRTARFNELKVVGGGS